MRSVFAALALLTSLAAPAVHAQEAQIKVGTTLRDANNYRLGTVSRVNPDGSVGIIVGSKFVIVPADSLSVVEGKAVTKLTKREIVNAH